MRTSQSDQIKKMFSQSLEKVEGAVADQKFEGLHPREAAGQFAPKPKDAVAIGNYAGRVAGQDLESVGSAKASGEIQHARRTLANVNSRIGNALYVMNQHIHLNTPDHVRAAQSRAVSSHLLASNTHRIGNIDLAHHYSKDALERMKEYHQHLIEQFRAKGELKEHNELESMFSLIKNLEQELLKVETIICILGENSCVGGVR